MKPRLVFALCAATVLGQLALAEERTVSPPALGMAEAMLDFCAQVDPGAAARYQAQAKLLVQGVPEKKVTEIRESDEYRQAHDSVAEMVGKVPRQDAVRACTDSLNPRP